MSIVVEASLRLDVAKAKKEMESMLGSPLKDLKINLSVDSSSLSSITRDIERIQKQNKLTFASGTSEVNNIVQLPINVDPITNKLNEVKSLVGERLKILENILINNDVNIKTGGGGAGLFSTLTSPLTNIVEGAFEGIGRDFTTGSGSAIAKGLESEISPLIGSFGNIGSLIGKEFGQGIITSLEGNLSNTQQLFGQLVGAEDIKLESANVRFLQAREAAEKYGQAVNQLNYEVELLSANPDFLAKQQQSIKAFSFLADKAQKKVDQLLKEASKEVGLDAVAKDIKATEKNISNIEALTKQLKAYKAEMEGLLESGGTTATDLLVIPQEINKVDKSLKELDRSLKKYQTIDKRQEDRYKAIDQQIKNRYAREIQEASILKDQLERLIFEFNNIQSTSNTFNQIASNQQLGLPSNASQLQGKIGEAIVADLPGKFIEETIQQQIDSITKERDEDLERVEKRTIQQRERLEQFIKENEPTGEQLKKIEAIQQDIESEYIRFTEKFNNQFAENLSAIKEGLQVFKPKNEPIKLIADRDFPEQKITGESSKGKGEKKRKSLNEVDQRALGEASEKSSEEASEKISRATLIFNRLIEEAIKASGVDPEQIKGQLPTLNKPKTLLEELKGVGAAGSFDHKQNAVNLSRAIYQRLEEGMLKPSDVGLIIHELRHGLQRGFSGSPSNTALSELMKIEDLENLSSEQANKLRNRVAFSSSTTTDPKVKQYKLKVEEDAYSFETKYQDEVYNNIQEFMRGLNKDVLALGQDPGIEKLRQETQELLSQDNAEEYLKGSTFSRKGLAKVAKDIGVGKGIVTKGKKSDLAKAVLELSKDDLEKVSQTIAEYGDSIRNQKFKTGIKGVRVQDNKMAEEVKEIQQAVKFLYKELNNIPSQITEESYGQIYGFISKIKTVGDALDKMASQTDLSSEFNKKKGGYVSSLKTLISRFSAKTQEDLGDGFNEVLKNLDSISLDFEKQVSDVLDGELDFGSKDVFKELDIDLDNIDQGFSDIFDFIKEAFGQGSNNLTDFSDDINKRIQEIESEINQVDNYVQGRKSQAPRGRFNPDFSINTESPEQKFVEAQTNLEGLLDQFDRTADEIEQRAISAEIGVNEALNGIGGGEDTIVNRIKRIFNAFTGDDGGGGGGGGGSSSAESRLTGIANGVKLVGAALAGVFLADLLELDSLIEQATELYGEVIEAAIAFESLQKSIEFTVGSAEKGAQGLAFVTAEADRLKVAVESAAEGYQQITAAAQGNEELQAIANKTTSAILQSSRALSLDAETQGRAIVALSQIASKGVVSQEELRGQLSEAIPNALQIASRSFSLTTKELNELIASGLDATTFLTVFSRQLDQETYFAAIQASDTLGASFQNLQNQIFLTKQALGTEIADGARLGMEGLATVLGLVADNSELIGVALKAGIFVGAVGLFKLAQIGIPFIIKGIGQINKILGITSLLTRNVNDNTTTLTPTFDKLGIKVQSLKKGLIGLNNFVGSIFQTPLKPGRFFESLQFTLQNIPKTLEGINQGFVNGLKGVQSFALGGVKAIGLLLKSIGAIASAIGPMVVTFVAFDAAINISQTLFETRNEMKEYRKELAKLDQVVQDALIDTSVDAITASEARRKAFLDEQNAYIKGLNFISNARKLFGGRTINEALIDRETEFNNEKLIEASQAIIDSRNLLNQSEEGKVSGEALEAQAKALQFRKDALNQVVALDAAQKERVDNEIKALDQEIKALNKAANAALGLSDAYGEVGKARLASIVAAKDAETQAIASLDEQIRQEVLTVEEGEFEKLKAKQERLDKQIAAEKLFLQSLDSKSEVEDRKKVEEQINKLVAEGYEVRSQVRQQETEEINQLASEIVNKATTAEQERIITILELEKQGLISKEEAERLKGKATLERIKQELKAEQEKLKAITELNGKDSIEYQQQQQATNSKVIELINAEISAQNNLSSAVSDTSSVVESSTDKNVENRKRELDVIKSQLDLIQQVQDRVRELEEVRFNFAQTTSQGDISLGELRVQQLRRALEIRRQLTSEESKNLSREQRNLLQEELGSLGVGGRQNEKSILEEIAKIERENAERKLELLKKEFDYKQRMLDLDIQRANIESKQQVLDAEKAVLDAESKVKQATSAKDRSNAEKELEIAKQQLQLTKDGQKALEEMNRLRQEGLDQQEQLALATERANQSSQSYETRGEIAEASKDDIAILKEQEKARIKEARDKARTDRNASTNLNDTIKQIQEETQTSINQIKEERRRGNQIVTPTINLRPITSPVSNTSTYRPPVPRSPVNQSGNMIDLKVVQGQINTLIKEIRNMGKPNITNNVNVPENDRTELIREIGNRVMDANLRALNYGV